MSTAQGILNGLLYLPESEPLRRKAELAKQVFKDFHFSTSDGFEAEARKVLNMSQQWAAATEYTLTELGIEAWVQKAVAEALTAAPARDPVVQAASRPAVAHPTMAAARHRAPARMMAATTLDNP